MSKDAVYIKITFYEDDVQIDSNFSNNNYIDFLYSIYNTKFATVILTSLQKDDPEKYEEIIKKLQQLKSELKKIQKIADEESQRQKDEPLIPVIILNE